MIFFASLSERLLIHKLYFNHLNMTRLLLFQLRSHRIYFFVLWIFAGIHTESFSATYTSTVGGGNWNAATSWTCNAGPCTFPKANDIVIIMNSIAYLAYDSWKLFILQTTDELITGSYFGFFCKLTTLQSVISTKFYSF